MTSYHSNLIFDQSRSVPSSISISNDWEAVVLDSQFIIQRRHVTRSNLLRIPQENGIVEVQYPHEIISVRFLDVKDMISLEDVHDLSIDSHDITLKQKHILSSKKITTIHNIPTNASLIIR